MKRFALVVAAIICCSPDSAFSQRRTEEKPEKGFFTRLALGYAFPQAGMTQLNGQPLDGSASLDGNNVSVTQRQVSFGQGGCLRLAGGYQFNRKFAAELGVHGVLSPEFSYSTPDAAFGNSLQHEYRTQGKGPVYLVPAFVFSTGTEWRIYGRAGVGLPVTNKVTQEEKTVNTMLNSVVEATREIELNFKPALEGALGVSHPLNEHLCIEGELSLISRNAYAKRSEMTKYTLDGKDGLSTFSTNQRITEYSLSYDSQYPQSASEPARAATFAIPFSSLGVNVGLRWNFFP